MADLPQDKKLVRVEYTYEDGSKYFLDTKNAGNYSGNMNMASGILAGRSYITFSPVEWTEIPKDDGRKTTINFRT